MFTINHLLHTITENHPAENHTTENHRIDPQVAVAAAMLCGAVKRSELRDADVFFENGLYEVILHSEYMDYECYVDGSTGEVVGFAGTPGSEIGA